MSLDFTDDELEEARKAFLGNCEFIISAVQPEQFPPEEMPEIAFVGRSNVGKSSLINALTNRKKLARTSNTPGRTRQINFFNLADHLLLADLPGYGYAKISKQERKAWRGLITTYLKKRRNLKLLALLIDGRHGFKESDMQMVEMLDDLGQNYAIITTKVDKVKAKHNPEDALNFDFNQHIAAFPHIIATSSEKKEGINLLQAVLYRITKAQ